MASQKAGHNPSVSVPVPFCQTKSVKVIVPCCGLGIDVCCPDTCSVVICIPSTCEVKGIGKLIVPCVPLEVGVGVIPHCLIVPIGFFSQKPLLFCPEVHPLVGFEATVVLLFVTCVTFVVVPPEGLGDGLSNLFCGTCEPE